MIEELFAGAEEALEPAQYFYYGIVDAETHSYGFLEEGDERITEDMIKLSADEWQELLDKQSEGLEIVVDNGQVIAAARGRYYIDDNGQWQKKTDEEFEQEQAKKRTQEFYNNFVVTSWGAFRKNPKGYSSAVDAVNTIFNMVNVAQSLTAELAQLLIFYEVPDFTDAEQCTEEWLVAHQKTHEACDIATFMQWYLEFQTVWAQTQYTDIPIPQVEL